MYGILEKWKRGFDSSKSEVWGVGEKCWEMRLGSWSQPRVPGCLVKMLLVMGHRRPPVQLIELTRTCYNLTNWKSGGGVAPGLLSLMAQPCHQIPSVFLLYHLQTSSPPDYRMTATVPNITFRHSNIHQKMDLTPCLVLYRGGYLPGNLYFRTRKYFTEIPQQNFWQFSWPRIASCPGPNQSLAREMDCPDWFILMRIYLWARGTVTFVKSWYLNKSGVLLIRKKETRWWVDVLIRIAVLLLLQKPEITAPETK